MIEFEVLEDIRSAVGKQNLSERIRGHSCRVDVRDMPSNRVLVNADLAFPANGIDGKRCDYVLFFFEPDTDYLLTAPIELKRGSGDASQVSEQIQQGAKFAERFAPQESESQCRPVLFHGKHLHWKERQELNRTKINFRGRDSTIRTARCGRPRNLANALEI